jgi:hypothetical protein
MSQPQCANCVQEFICKRATEVEDRLTVGKSTISPLHAFVCLMCAGLGTTFFLGISTAATQRNLSTVLGGQVRTGENSGRVRGGGAECAARAGIFSRWAAGQR